MLKDITEIPIVKAACSKSPAERLEIVVADLQRRGASKPRKLKTLGSTINSIFQKSLSEQEIEALLDALKEQGYVTVTENGVSYSLPN